MKRLMSIGIYKRIKGKHKRVLIYYQHLSSPIELLDNEELEWGGMSEEITAMKGKKQND